ncbi:ACP phosphodiesterase [Massilia eburnea]|uniref:ACP phosphodiesterase n=1 Tax=Massilia eburnea TaxID=1776165 RepID=UPI003D6A1C86
MPVSCWTCFTTIILSQRWDEYCEEPRQELIETLLRRPGGRTRGNCRSGCARSCPKLIKQDWLGAYGEFSGVELALTRMSDRLSRNGHLLREGIGEVQQHYEAIADGFDRFFPELGEIYLPAPPPVFDCLGFLYLHWALPALDGQTA